MVLQVRNGWRSGIKFIVVTVGCLLGLALAGWMIGAEDTDQYTGQETGEQTREEQPERLGQEEGKQEQSGEDTAKLYEEYRQGFEGVEQETELAEGGFTAIEEHIFPLEMGAYGEVRVIPAFHKEYNRLVLFFALPEGEIVYKTEELETNNRNRGELKQFTNAILAISFRDLDGDGGMDIVLITSFTDREGEYAGDSYKVGDVLFQNKEGDGFYRDYRITDKLNRFSMNKSADLIAAFVRDGVSTEFMYTAATLEELLNNGLEIITEQSYPRNFEKLGRLQVIPGTCRIADYEIFMVYLVNEEGYIVSSLQPMGDYDNLYALKGISCWDIDGDGLKDIAVLARYSYEGSDHQLIVETDYSIYYQRTSGFILDKEIKESYQCSEDETMENLVRQGRAYWGWKREE